jgi:hypothetical protein
MKIIIEPNGTIRFEDSTSMLRSRSVHGLVYHQGEVISVCDARRNVAFRGTSERLDTLTQTRTQLAERLPNGLGLVTAAILGNKLLVVGGEYQFAGQEVSSDIVYELDEHASQAGQGKWRAHAARLNTARSWAAAIAFEGKLFVCGGVGAFRIVESFDPAIGAWQVEGDMTKARFNFSLFVHEEELYAVSGDEDGSTTIEKRNKDTKQWEHVTDCGQDRYACAAALVGSKVFLFGGFKDESMFDFFDLQSKKWASQDVGGAYFDHPKLEQDEDEDEDEPVSKRQLPRKFYGSKAVLITPPAALTKKWTDLNVVKLEDRDTARFDDRFEAVTGKAIEWQWDA